MTTPSPEIPELLPQGIHRKDGFLWYRYQVPATGEMRVRGPFFSYEELQRVAVQCGDIPGPTPPEDTRSQRQKQIDHVMAVERGALAETHEPSDPGFWVRILPHHGGNGIAMDIGQDTLLKIRELLA